MSETADKNKDNDLETLMSQRTQLESAKYRLEQQLRGLETELSQNKKLILKTCRHNWVRDTAYYGPYEKPDDICTRARTFFQM